MKKTKEELEEECRKLHRIDRWYGLLVVSGMCIVLFGLLVLDNLTVTFIGTVPALIAVIFLSSRFHCPYCGRFLKTKFGLPERCPYCGESLAEKEPDAPEKPAEPDKPDKK